MVIFVPTLVYPLSAWGSKLARIQLKPSGDTVRFLFFKDVYLSTA